MACSARRRGWVEMDRDESLASALLPEERLHCPWGRWICRRKVLWKRLVVEDFGWRLMGA